MCKYVMFPLDTTQDFLNPDNDNNFRHTLLGCNGMGVGTVVESQMVVQHA